MARSTTSRRRGLLVGHLERLDQLRAEGVTLSLVGELLLEPHAFGDVAGVEHDASHMAVVAEVADMRVEVAPFALGVANAQDDLRRPPFALDLLTGAWSSSCTNRRKPSPRSSASGRPSAP